MPVYRTTFQLGSLPGSVIPVVLSWNSGTNLEQLIIGTRFFGLGFSRDSDDPGGCPAPLVPDDTLTPARVFRKVALYLFLAERRSLGPPHELSGLR